MLAGEVFAGNETEKFADTLIFVFEIVDGGLTSEDDFEIGCDSLGTTADSSFLFSTFEIDEFGENPLVLNEGCGNDEERFSGVVDVPKLNPKFGCGTVCKALPKENPELLFASSGFFPKLI